MASKYEIQNTKHVRKLLNKSIGTALVELPQYLRLPEKDFSRDKKDTPKMVICLLLQKGSGSLTTISGDFFGRDGVTPSASALVKQRMKIKPELFERVFYEFVGGTTHIFSETFLGYHVLADDGTDLCYPANPKEPEYYVSKGDNSKANNFMHIDVLCDVFNECVVDVSMDGTRKKDEKAQGIRLIQRCRFEKAIIMGDRGFESFEYIVTIEQKGYGYIIRFKDIDSNGIASTLGLPEEGEFDVSIRVILTNRQTREVKALMAESPDAVKYINPDKFPFLPKVTDRDEAPSFYTLEFRLVRIEVEEGKFVLLATNLPRDKFPPYTLKILYHRRWNIEVNFRFLKYTLDMLSTTSRTSALIKQEVYAKLIMYNFVRAITARVHFVEKGRKHMRKLDFTAAVGAVRDWINGRTTVEGMIDFISKHTIPIRLDRKWERRMKSKAPRGFCYRGA